MYSLYSEALILPLSVSATLKRCASSCLRVIISLAKSIAQIRRYVIHQQAWKLYLRLNF